MSETETRAVRDVHDALAWRGRAESAEAELSRLRDVVEAVQALADDWVQPYDDPPIDPHPTSVRHADALRAVLAPVSSSGEAESGDLIPCCEHCGCPANDRSGHDDTCRNGCNDPAPVPSGVPDLLAALGSAVERARQDRRATTVPSGGQADGEGEARPLGSTVSTVDLAICANCREKITRVPAASAWYHVGHCGVHGQQRCQKAATDALAARPVLSREALVAAILSARDSYGNLVDYLSATTAEYVADAILADGEQA